jgi:hypothetical protein
MTPITNLAIQMYRSLARRCARICTKTNRFLLAIRKLDDFLETSRFPLVKRVTNCNEKHGSEIDDFAILSLARLPELPSGSQIIHLPCPTRSFMAGSSFPSCQARPKSSSRIESKRPSAAASWAIARSTSSISDAVRFAGRHRPLFGLLNKVFACLANAQQDAQLPRVVFPRVPTPVVEHTRYNSSRKRQRSE